MKKRITKQKPLLSVVIPTYNRETLMEKCLRSVLNQKDGLDRCEVIVVDNNCTDGTAEMVDKYALQYHFVKRIIAKKQGLQAARNAGGKVTISKYILYLDDDGYLPKGFLLNMLNVLDTFKPDIAGGPVLPYYTDTKPNWFKDSFETRKSAKVSGYSSTCRISGGNFLIKKKVLEKIGYFDEAIGMVKRKLAQGGEALLLDTYRMSTPEQEHKVYYCIECPLMHIVPKYKMKRRYQLKRKYIGGKASIMITSKKKPLTKMKIKSLRRSILRHMYGDLIKEIQTDGIFNANYALVGMNSAKRIGRYIGGKKIYRESMRNSKVIKNTQRIISSLRPSIERLACSIRNKFQTHNAIGMEQYKEFHQHKTLSDKTSRWPLLYYLFKGVIFDSYKAMLRLGLNKRSNRLILSNFGKRYGRYKGWSLLSDHQNKN